MPDTINVACGILCFYHEGTAPYLLMCLLDLVGLGLLVLSLIQQLQTI